LIDAVLAIEPADDVATNGVDAPLSLTAANPGSMKALRIVILATQQQLGR